MAFGPAWQGWESYRQFSESVKTQSRYVWSPETNQFLQDVLSSCGSRKLAIPKGHTFWRARLGCEFEEVTQVHNDVEVAWTEDRPFSRENMKPIPNWQTEGRANSRGIPCLYVATTRETALAEIRPWVGATSSVAQLRATRNLNVIEC